MHYFKYTLGLLFSIHLTFILLCCQLDTGKPQALSVVPSTTSIPQPIQCYQLSIKISMGALLPRTITSIPLKGQLNKQVSPSHRTTYFPSQPPLFHSLPRVILLICNSHLLPRSNPPEASHNNKKFFKVLPRASELPPHSLVTKGKGLLQVFHLLCPLLKHSSQHFAELL